MGNISCEFEISTYNTLCSRGPTKSLLKVEKTPVAAILFFKNEAKNIPRQDFMVMNISCKFEKGSYSTLSVKISPQTYFGEVLWRSVDYLQ